MEIVNDSEKYIDLFKTTHVSHQLFAGISSRWDILLDLKTISTNFEAFNKSFILFIENRPYNNFDNKNHILDQHLYK